MPNWQNILSEITERQFRARSQAHFAVDEIRQKYVTELANYTERNVIIYYSGWQSKPGSLASSIIDDDRNGFMAAIHDLSYPDGLDLILHTPGGSVAATQSIIKYLREKFGKDLRVFIPHTAMSAGTIIACSAKKIFMSRHSSIGPIDPQLRGVSAKGVLQEIETAYSEITKDPSREVIWKYVLQKYTPTFIGDCKNAIKWSEEFCREMLLDNMFYEEKEKENIVDGIIKRLTDYDEVKLHERQIDYHEASDIGLKIDLVEDDQILQDKVLSVHHCCIHTLANTEAIKIIENHKGASYVKMEQSEN